MKKFIFILSVLFVMPVLAAMTQITTLQDKSIPVYDQPNSNNKPVVTLTKGQRVIAIYEQNNWLKVANPDNGNVGWVKKEDWQSAAKNVITIEQVGNGYSITSKNADGSMNSTYRVIQTSGDNKANSEEMNTFFSDLQKQQQTMQQHFEQIRQDMMKNMEAIDARMKQLWKENTPTVIENPKNQKTNQQNNSKK